MRFITSYRHIIHKHTLNFYITRTQIPILILRIEKKCKDDLPQSTRSISFIQVSLLFFAIVK